MNDNYFVTLPSDSSAKYYPNNTVARLVTELLETIRLQGQYEMVLVEIIYPHNRYYVNDENEDNYWIAATNKDAMQKVYLPSAYYEYGNALVEALKFVQVVGAKFSFDRASGRLSLNFRSTGSQTMRMSDDLQSIMGFEDILDCDKSFGAVGERDFDANRGLNLMYVYCDMATHSIVGDTKTLLLRVCTVAGKHGEYVRHTYAQPQYVPVGWHEFDTIEIAIYNDAGKPMPFQYGKSVVTLNFRRRHGHHFYLTLPSNNVKLPERIRLDDDFDLGIMEIVYPHTWYNVGNDDEKYWIGAYNVFTNQFPFPKMYPKSGFYADGETFASSLTH
jgi:hypothetical protein